MDTKGSVLVGGLLALPWCCIMPAGFSALGLSGVALAGQVSQAVVPYLLAVSVLFLGRAYYLLYIKRQGNRFSHGVTWITTAVAIGSWLIVL